MSPPPYGLEDDDILILRCIYNNFVASERAMGFEPMTFSLARRRSTTELRPHPIYSNTLAGAAGLEPTTYGFGDRCSAKLSYAPMAKGSGGRIRTCDLWVMSPTSYLCSTPHRFLMCYSQTRFVPPILFKPSSVSNQVTPDLAAPGLLGVIQPRHCRCDETGLNARPTHLAPSCTLAQPTALPRAAGGLLPHRFTPYLRPQIGIAGGSALCCGCSHAAYSVPSLTVS